MTPPRDARSLAAHVRQLAGAGDVRGLCRVARVLEAQRAALGFGWDTAGSAEFAAKVEREREAAAREWEWLDGPGEPDEREETDMTDATEALTLAEACETAREAVAGVLAQLHATEEQADAVEEQLLCLARHVRDLSESGRAMDKVAARAHWTYTMAGDFIPALTEARREFAGEWAWLGDAEAALDERQWRRIPVEEAD